MYLSHPIFPITHIYILLTIALFFLIITVMNYTIYNMEYGIIYNFIILCELMGKKDMTIFLKWSFSYFTTCPTNKHSCIALEAICFTFMMTCLIREIQFSSIIFAASRNTPNETLELTSKCLVSRERCVRVIRRGCSSLIIAQKKRSKVRTFVLRLLNS